MEMKETAPGGDKACAFIRGHFLFIAEKVRGGSASPDIQDHLGSCPECNLLVQRFARAWYDTAQKKETRPDPTFFPRLMRRIEAHEKFLSAPSGILVAAWRILRPAALTAVFLGGIFVGNEMGKTGKLAVPPEEPFAGRFFDSFENIPSGSVADFFVRRQNPKRRSLE